MHALLCTGPRWIPRGLGWACQWRKFFENFGNQAETLMLSYPWLILTRGPISCPSWHAMGALYWSDRMKTVDDILANLAQNDERRGFWGSVARFIAQGRYTRAMELVLPYYEDDDFPDQIRCTAESIARHHEANN